MLNSAGMCTYSKFVNYDFCSNGHSIAIASRGPLHKKGSYNHTNKTTTNKSNLEFSLVVIYQDLHIIALSVILKNKLSKACSMCKLT